MSDDICIGLDEYSIVGGDDVLHIKDFQSDICLVLFGKNPYAHRGMGLFCDASSALEKFVNDFVENDSDVKGIISYLPGFVGECVYSSFENLLTRQNVEITEVDSVERTLGMGEIHFKELFLFPKSKTNGVMENLPRFMIRYKNSGGCYADSESKRIELCSSAVD